MCLIYFCVWGSGEEQEVEQGRIVIVVELDGELDGELNTALVDELEDVRGEETLDEALLEKKK